MTEDSELKAGKLVCQVEELLFIQSQNWRWKWEPAPLSPNVGTALDLEFHVVQAHLAKQAATFPGCQIKLEVGRRSERTSHQGKEELLGDVGAASWGPRFEWQGEIFTSYLCLTMKKPRAQALRGFPVGIANTQGKAQGQPLFYRSRPPSHDNTCPPNADMGALEFSLEIIWLAL